MDCTAKTRPPARRTRCSPRSPGCARRYRVRADGLLWSSTRPGTGWRSRPTTSTRIDSRESPLKGTAPSPQAAEIAYWRDDRAASIAPLEEALKLASELNSTLDTSDLLRIRGDGYVRANELGRAEDDYVRAMELARQAGAPEMVAAARAGLGELARVRGDLDAALRLNEAALAECPVGWFGADATRFGILVGLGRIAEATGDAEAASAWYRLALTETAGVRTLPELAQAIEGLVGIELASGDAERAAILLGATTALRDAAGAVNVVSIAATVRSQLGEADYESAFGRGAEMTREQARALIAGN